TVLVDQSTPSCCHFRKIVFGPKEPGALSVIVVNWSKVRVNCVVPLERPLLSVGVTPMVTPLFGLEEATVTVRGIGTLNVSEYAPVVSDSSNALAKIVYVPATGKVMKSIP